ncbi:MAG: hypothetical protein IH621_04335, partial [Krumholzibacteria bacterium]|nr:hypothetical protein [Candidatus Krumholzibacteria bacterium]
MLHQIAAAGDDGLEPADYHLRELMTLLAFVAPVGEPVWADAEAGSRAEDLLTDAFLGLGVDLARGRLEPGALWKAWSPAGVRPGPLPRLADVAIGLPGAAPVRSGAAADTLLAALEGCRPTQPGYRELRGALTDLRNIAATGGWPTVADGPLLRPGD